MARAAAGIAVFLDVLTVPCHGPYSVPSQRYPVDPHGDEPGA